jgi:hypothetical protein
MSELVRELERDDPCKPKLISLIIRPILAADEGKTFPSQKHHQNKMANSKETTPVSRMT